VRPHFVKPLAPQPADAPEDDSEAEEAEAAVAETQLPAEPEASDHDLSDNGSDYASDVSHTPKQRKVVPPKKPAAKEEKAGVVKTAARKVKATAHANYRKLKIKGQGGNGGGAGGRGRFGRRR
jgi:26S proteasome regulatory subunit N12